MDEEKLLRSPLQWQRQRRPALRIGEGIQSYLESQQKQLRKNSRVVDAWREVLPEAFREYCQLRDVARGVVTVAVKPGPFMHQLRLASESLLEELQRVAGLASLRKIRLIAWDVEE